MTKESQSPELTVRDFDFDLPEELIAQQPPAERGASRLLAVRRDLDRMKGADVSPCVHPPQEAGAPVPEDSRPPFTDLHFHDFPRLLNPGDLLVLNDSRVIPARLFGRRANSRGKQAATGQIEVLLTTPGAAWNWHALVRPGRKVRIGDTLEFPDASGQTLLRANVLAAGEFGERTLGFEPVADFYAALDRIGHIPLPPYIKRDDSATDRERYQTVFAERRGSVAAPTAGLHFTAEILAAIAARGVEIAKITLHVGLGTFAPLRVEKVSEIQLHCERYTLPATTAEALNRARAEGRRIVAVGTTTVRTLEHVAQQSSQPLQPHSGETSIFLFPGHRFLLVDALLTNFHLPQSSLLMLVSAFAGRERTLSAYRHAVDRKYRFFSYGDCMFLH